MSTPWECCVCYQDGARTGRVTLTKCNHTICLACCNGILTSAPTWKKDHIKCPLCRVFVPVATAPNRLSEEHLRNWAEWNLEMRVGLNKLEQMITEPREEREKRAITNQLEALRINVPMWMKTLKDMADDWGLWEKYEAMTHPPSTAVETLPVT